MIEPPPPKDAPVPQMPGQPRPEREFLAELREAASTPPVESWLLYVVDHRLAELDGKEL